MKTKQQFSFLIAVVVLFQLVACGQILSKSASTEVAPIKPLHLTHTIYSTNTPSPTQTPFPTHTPFPSIVPFLTDTPFISVTPSLDDAAAMAKQGRCTEAMPILEKLIEEHPGWIEPYEIHGLCSVGFQSNVFEERQGYLLAALRDANKLIEIMPKSGEYYAWRNYVLRQMTDLETYSVNKFAIYDLANQDVVKAIELGVSPTSYAYRHYARNLIEGNHCQEGLVETQEQIDKTTKQSPDFGQYYSIYLTEAYICLGKLDKALENAQYVTCDDDPVSTCKSGLLAQIYLQSGDYKNALDTINSMIDRQPTGGGWRYFIRALIHYELGEKELALQDLELGEIYSWFENGVYWYVKAKLAIDAGDKENGIIYLQNAEQTLDVTYMPLRQQIIKELKSYGEKPIVLTPDLPFTPAPVP
jgi:tetratricopeptide (TPR) repeat protein